MVSNLTLLHIHLRLTEIFGCKRGNNNWFGSQNVIVFDDLLQLPPVKGDEVFIPLSEAKVKETTGAISTQLSLWSHFSYDELTINQRQKNDSNAEFKNCLSRIRTGIISQSDIELLKSRRIKISNENPMESIVKHFHDLAKNGEFPVFILPTRAMVKDFNEALLANPPPMPLASESPSPVIEIQALDELACMNNKMKENAQEHLTKMDKDDRNTAGLEKCLRLSKGTRVMLRRNIDTGKKLVNGSTGTIINFEYDQRNQVQQIIIQFDGIKDPIEIKRDKRKIRIFDHAYVYREQFPITCAYAITVHKSQGLSLKCVMADLGDSIFSDGQIYVALSRVQSLSGLHIININFNKIKASSKAIAFYASVSKQDYSRKIHRKKTDHNEVIWYTKSKQKYQTALIKGVIDDEIKAVPEKIYTRNKSNVDNQNSNLLTNKRKNLMNVEREPHSSKLKRQRITENLSSLAQQMWNYDPVGVIDDEIKAVSEKKLYQKQK